MHKRECQDLGYANDSFTRLFLSFDAVRKVQRDQTGRLDLFERFS